MICEVCRNVHNNKRFCSVKCRNSVIQKIAIQAKKDKAVVITCGQCSVSFKPGSKARKFCSRKCFGISERKYSVCPCCETRFRNTRGTTWCSISCRSKSVPRKRGYHLTDEHKRKIGDSQRGEKGSSWRGGVTPWQKKERRKPEYIAWRKAVFERDGYTCQHCGKIGGELHADHIKSWIAYPELRTEMSNGRTLCVACHRKTPTYARNLKYQI